MTIENNRTQYASIRSHENMQAYPYVEEDEINLLDLFLVLVKHKLLIIGLVFISGIASVTASLMMTNIYRSEATIAPREDDKGASIPIPSLGGLGGLVAGQLGLGGGGSLEKLEVVLKSRDLTKRVINKYELMPVIFSEDWDQNAKKWMTDEPPTLQDGWEMILEDLLKVTADSENSTLKIGFEHENPETAQKIVNYYLTELSETLREEVLRDATENKRFFNEQLLQTGDTLLREKIYALLAKEIEEETFARAQKHFSFTVIDPPVVADPNKEIKPKRSLICILSVMAALFVAVILSFIIEFVRRMKTEDPKCYKEITDGLKLWRKSRSSQKVISAES